MSKKNCPPGDPPGGPKSLLEAKKSLLEMKIGASDAFLAFHDRFLVDFTRNTHDFLQFFGRFSLVFCELFGHRCASRHTVKIVKKLRKNHGFFNVRALAAMLRS